MNQSTTRRGASLIWQFARTHPRPFALSLIGGTLWGAAVVASTWTLGWVVDKVLTPGFRGTISSGTAWAGVGALVGIGVLRGIAVVLRRWYGSVTEARVQADLRATVGERMLTMPFSEHRRRPTGVTLAIADSDVTFSTTALMPVPLTVGLVALIGLSFASLWATDWTFALIAAVLFPSLYVTSRWFTERMIEPAELSQQQVGAVSAIAHESFEGQMVVKTLGLESSEQARFEAASSTLRTHRLKLARLSSLYQPIVDALPFLGMVALIWVGAIRMQSGAVTEGEIIAAVGLFGWLNFPVRVAGFLFESLPRAVVSSGRVFEYVDGAAAPEFAPDGVHTGMGCEPGPLGVELSGVRFGYGTPDEPLPLVLDGIDCSIAPGEVVALVGPTGSGKSTLAQLLVRLDEPQTGTIRIGGTDISTADPVALRRDVALVFQESFLFADSIADNIALGLVDAGPNDAGPNDAAPPAAAEPRDERIASALKTAHADTFVGHLPSGVETVVGERGVTLSGGQRQRIALARALASRPRVLILDDATSAVDPAVEAEILGSLRSLDQATTMIVVAHRLSTIRLADRVLFLSDGVIAASGRHEDLLEIPAYAALASAYEGDEYAGVALEELVEDALPGAER